MKTGNCGLEVWKGQETPRICGCRISQYLVLCSAKKGAGSSVEECVSSRHRGGGLLGNFIPQIFDQNLVGRFVHHSKPIACNEHRRCPGALFGLLRGDKHEL